MLSDSILPKKTYRHPGPIHAQFGDMSASPGIIPDDTDGYLRSVFSAARDNDAKAEIG